MLRPETMHRVKIIGLRKDKKSVMAGLQKAGVVHLKKSSLELDRETPDEIIHDAVRELETLRRVKRVLSKPKGIVRDMLGEKSAGQVRTPLSDGKFEGWAKKILGKISEDTDSILADERALASEKAALHERIGLLSDFSGLDVNLEDFGEKKHVITGLARVEAGSMEKLGKLASVTNAGGDENTRSVLFAVPRNSWDKASRMLALIAVDGKGRPKEIIEDSRHRLRSIEENAGVLEERKDMLRKSRPLMLALEERWKNIKNRASSENMLVRTKKTFVAEGWAPASSISELVSMDGAVIHIEDETGDAPVKLDNPSFVKFFEVITRWFALPKYGGIDPTIFIAVAFPVFFAIMLTDIAYGIGLAALGVYVYKRAGSDGARNIGGILLVSSVFTILAGAAFGSFFGNALGFPSLFDALRDPITIMTISLGIGLVHINLGLGLGILSGLSERNWRAVLEPLSWLSFETALALMASGLFGLALPPWAGMAILALIGFTLLVQAQKGITGVIGVPGFVGNWISYIRLMALAVATSWLAFVINLGAAALASVSLVPAAIFFGAGHLFLWALNSVSAFVHSMRLHYVEFFKLFYEGGGSEYDPLRLEKQYHE